MRPTPPHARVWHGTSRIFAAELLILPTGLVTAGFLTRQLGAEAYGWFTLTASVVGWLQWTANSMLARATNRAVAGTANWRPVAAEVVRLHLLVGLMLGAAVVAVAGPLAGALRQPEITASLRLLAIDLPLSALASAYRGVLIGIGDHGARATSSAVRWLVRMLAIVAFVQLGWSITGAVLGILAASAAELAVARWRVGALGRATRADARTARADLLGLAVPVALAAIAMRTFDRADLFLLSMLGADPASLGHYGAAQNLTVVVALLASSVSPVVLATITRLHRTGDAAAARHVAMESLRLPFLVLPFAGLAAGAAPEIMRAVYGRAFLDAAVPFAWLMLAAIALLAVSVATVLLVAADRPWLVLATSAPMLATLGAAGVVLIPRHGGAGAAQTTLLAATMGAVVSMAVAVRTLGLRLPARSMLVGGGLAVLAFGAARAWPADGIVATVVEVAVLAAAIALVLVGTREFRPAEVGVVFGRRAFRAAT